MRRMPRTWWRNRSPRAWAEFYELRDRERFDGWLLRVLANTFVSEWRHRRSELELTEQTAAGVDEPAEDAYLYTKLHQPFLLWGDAENVPLPDAPCNVSTFCTLACTRRVGNPFRADCIGRLPGSKSCYTAAIA